MGNSPNKSTIQKQKQQQTEFEQQQKITPKDEKNDEKKEVKKEVKKEEKKKDDLETEFLKFLADGQRKEKWKKYFQVSQIYSMEDLLSTYQMRTDTKTGRRLNEAEIQILNNYLLKQSKEESVVIIERGIKDLKVFQYLEQNASHNLKQIRNILVLGITGQGKSTFINSFVTAIEREFEPRRKVIELQLDYFKIIKVNNQSAASDTDQVSSYKFAYKDYLINIIDTPGLADTAGAKKDQDRIKQISEYIQENLQQKKQKLHAVLFVSQSSTQYEIVDNNPTLIQLSMLSILKLFGKSMCEFTKHCLTFSDFTATFTQNFESPNSIFYSIKQEQYLIQQQKNEQQSNFQETANQQQINQKQQSQNQDRNQENNKVSKDEFYFQFQNSVFQAQNQGFIENIHFKKNFDNYKGLLNFIIDENNGGFNLDETQKVIQERITINTQLGLLQSNLQQCLKIYKTLQENNRKLKIYISKKKDSSNFESTIFITKWDKQYIFKNGSKAYSTNCLTCSKTCCKGCDSKKLNDCVKMFKQYVNNKQELLCLTCTHSAERHIQQEFFWQATQEPKIIVDEYLKKENDEAKTNITTISELVKDQEDKRSSTKQEILSILIKMKNCLTTLLSSALYKLDILDIEAYDFVIKFYPEYEEYIKEFKDNLELKVTKSIREQAVKNKLEVSQTLQSLATTQFQKKQFIKS